MDRQCRDLGQERRGCIARRERRSRYAPRDPERFDKEAALIADELWLDDQHFGDGGRDDVHALCCKPGYAVLSRLYNARLLL